ncbi:MAG TPA: hypothetical protein VE476_13755 [Propionibacteriaceae bacterium]|nr:hypothetical protein [Propionibacteriaceae bacterium]
MDPELGPCVSNPDAYQVLFENDRVRFLRYIGDTDSRAIFIELKDGGPPAATTGARRRAPGACRRSRLGLLTRREHRS